MKACRQSRRWLELQFAGELSWKQELRLQAHLAECSECAVLSRAQDHVLEGLGSYREAPLAKIDLQRFVGKVQERIADEPVGQVSLQTEETDVPHKRYALAAAVLLAVGMYWVLGNSGAVQRRELGTGVEKVVKSTQQEPSMSEEELAQAPPSKPDAAATDGTEYRPDRHQAVISDLRSALGSLMGQDPNWPLYEARISELRAAGWPMANLLSGLVGDEHLETAQAAIRALGRERGRLAQRRLWNLRMDERLGGFAVKQLQVRGELSTAHVVELYWKGGQRSVALEGLERLNGEEALLGARRFLREVPKRKLTETEMSIVAGLLQRAGDAGSVQALTWLESNRLPQEAWAAQVAATLELKNVLGAYLEDGGGVNWESGALTLAGHLGDDQWIPFLEKCCHRSRTAERAVAALAKQPGLQALELLLAQESNGIVSEDVWLSAWDKALALDAKRLAAMAQSFRSSGSRDELERFAEVLLLSEQEGSGAALVELAGARDLNERLRCTLVLRVGQLKEAGAEYGLESILGQLDRSDSKLAACLVIALSNMRGSESLAALLERNSKASGEVILQIVALCDGKSRRSERERRYLIARKLKKVLGRRNLSSLE